MDVRTLTIKWSTSHGRETYGYNICTLTDGGKRYRCKGGGYDMVGTVLGKWLEDVHQDALRGIGNRAYYTWTSYPLLARENGLYGMYLRESDGSVTIDGACGIESVTRIAAEIGVTITRAKWDRKGNTTAYNAIVED